jgi:hypothetical protein
LASKRKDGYTKSNNPIDTTDAMRILLVLLVIVHALSANASGDCFRALTAPSNATRVFHTRCVAGNNTETTIMSLTTTPMPTFSPSFHPFECAYNLTFPAAVSSFAMLIQPSNADATISSSYNGTTPFVGGLGISKPLSFGNNVLLIRVVASDGIGSSLYNFKIHRKRHEKKT